MNWQYSFVSLALTWLNGPIVGALGCYVCASRIKAHYWKIQGSIYFGRKLLSKDALPPKKILANNELKFVSLLWKEFFPKKWGVLIWKRDVSLPERVWYRKNFRQIHVHSFFITIVYNPLPPLKILNRTQGTTPFQARTASPLFFFSCRFL